ncbi:MAG: hypothetical protein NTV49_06625 [Kiritimatiellaeota bacterium]|nr:hypothetical protein [Kiritimatiellota bacterium]
MKIWAGVLTCAVSLALITGCDSWNWGGSADSWNESGGWQDVSGQYVGVDGYLVSNYSNLIPITTNAVITYAISTNSITKEIGTTVAAQAFYSGVITPLPIVPASITIFVGTSPSVTLVGNASGALAGSGGSGTINYTTGAYSITLTAAPVGGQSIQAVYLFTSGGGTSGGEVSGGGNNPGGSSIITAFVVEQAGNNVKFTDNNGSIYSGSMGTVSTNIGSGTNISSISASYSYDVRGVSAAGMNVEMVGSFLVNGVAQGTNGTIIVGTQMTGTWLEEGGKTGHIKGVRQ